jgi:hypothetical protein
MISIQKNFLFVHIPKTGGNSIQNILQKYSDDKLVILGDHQDGKERFEIRNSAYPNLEKHSTLNDYKVALENETFHSLFKFATIRNPWDMMISYYFSPHRGITEWSRDGFLELLVSVPRFKYFTEIQSKPSKRLFFFKKKNNIEEVLLDFVLRFEHIDEDFKKLCALIDIPHEPLPKRNQSKRKHYSSYYDDELIQKVAKKFSFEISYGEYKFESK